MEKLQPDCPFKIYWANDLHTHGYHFHNAYEMIFITKGQVAFEIDGKERIYGENHLVFLNQHENHCMVPLSAEYERYVATVEPDYFNQMIAGSMKLASVFKRRPKGFDNGLCVSGQSRRWVEESLRACLREYEEDRVYAGEAIRAELLLLLIRIYREYPPFFPDSAGSHKEDWAGKVQEYLEKHFDEECTLIEVAAVFHVSPYHLAHVFREETGYTVKQYVLLKRVYHAKNLLVHSGMSVSEAAAAVGFNSTNNFIRAFKSSEGMTPGGFRKKFAGSPTAAADGPE